MQQLNQRLIRLDQQQMFAEYPDMLTIPLLQRMMQIGEHAAYDLVRSGKIGSIRIGRGYRIPKSAVKKFIYENS